MGEVVRMGEDVGGVGQGGGVTISAGTISVCTATGFEITGRGRDCDSFDSRSQFGPHLGASTRKSQPHVEELDLGRVSG